MKLLVEAAQLTTERTAGACAKPAGKARLMRLADLDGRTKARRAAEKMFRDLIDDLGGPERVSAAKRALAESAAVLKAMADDQGARYLAGEPVELTAYATIANSLRRLLADTGLERYVAAGPSVSKYLDARDELESRIDRGFARSAAFAATVMGDSSPALQAVAQASPQVAACVSLAEGAHDAAGGAVEPSTAIPESIQVPAKVGDSHSVPGTRATIHLHEITPDHRERWAVALDGMLHCYCFSREAAEQFACDKLTGR